MRRKKSRVLVAAEWLRSTDKSWWFYQQALCLNRHFAEIVLVGNHRLYNQSDRNNIPGHVLYVLKTLLYTLRLAQRSNRQDVVFCWNQLPALTLAALCKTFGLKRNVVCQNFLYRAAGSGRLDVLRTGLYNYCLKYGGLCVSLQSPELFAHYTNKGLALSRARCYYVRDCLPEGRMPEEIVSEAKRVAGSVVPYVFTGGEANRDWQLVTEVAAAMPQLSFRCVARKRFFNPALAVPANVAMYWDVSLREYFTHLAQSAVVLIPIKDAYNPAGLLLLFDAILAGKTVAASATPYLGAYLSPHQDLFSFATSQEGVRKIESLLQAPAPAQLNDLLRANLAGASPEAFVSAHLHKMAELSEVR